MQTSFEVESNGSWTPLGAVIDETGRATEHRNEWLSNEGWITRSEKRSKRPVGNGRDDGGRCETFMKTQVPCGRQGRRQLSSSEPG